MKKYSSLILLHCLSAISFAQGHFVVAYTGNGQDHMNINVVTATIGGVPLDAGDEIAAFDGSICCGKVILTQPIVFSNNATFAKIAASRKDEAGPNGYTIGNPILYKLWDSSANLEISGLTVEYYDPVSGQPTTSPTYSVNGLAFVKLTLPSATNQAPVAHAGTDQSPNESTLVTLDGSASTDANNDQLTYLWTAPTGITLSSNTAQKPTFTAPEVTADTPYTFSLVVNDGKVNSAADQVVVTVKQVNKAPVASAGIDQAVNENSLFTLDGSGSSDNDNDILTYLWTAPTGITLSSNTVQKPTFTAPEVTADTPYTFSVVVNDGKANSSADQVVVTVKQVNKVPVASAGIDQAVNENSLFTLDGSGSSDPDNDILTYLWTAPTGITLSSNTVQKPTFTAPEVTADTPYTFSLVVNDGKVNSVADQVVVTVKQVNKVPVASAGIDQVVNENSLFTLDGSGSSDPDNDILTYLWTSPTGITLSSNTVQKPTFTAPEVTSNTNYTFSLVVKDGILESAADQVTITVKQGNKLPVANAGIDQSVNEGILVTLDGTASTDPDADPLIYTWIAPEGIALSSTSASKPTFTAPEVTADTNFEFSLLVNDGTINSNSDPIIVTVKHVNKVPIANAGTDMTENEGTIVALDGSASTDGDNDPLTYLWTAPTGITLSSNTAQKPTFTAPEVTADTPYTFSLVVNDGKVNSAADQVVITVKQVNKVPVASAGIDEVEKENSLFTLDGSGSSDPDNDILTYLWTAPTGITLSSNTVQKPTFTAPEVITDTPYIFSLVVNDWKVNSLADLVVITVKQVNKVPIANAGTDQSVVEKSVYTLDGSASSDPDQDVLIYKWTTAPGISLSATNVARPTFSAPDVSITTTYTFSLVVSDGKFDSPADQVVITVKLENTAPTAHAGAVQTVNEGSVVTLNGTASVDPDNDPLIYNWTAPSGITMNASTGPNPTFTAPEVTADTNFTFSLTVNDGTASSPETQVTITVKQVNEAPVYLSAKLFQANEDQLVEFLLEGADNENDPISFSIENLPSVLNLTTKSPNSVVLSGIFTKNYIGNNPLKLTLSDGASSTQETINILVAHVDHAPYVKDSIKNISVEKRSPHLIINLTTVFADDDSEDVVTYAVESNTNNKIITPQISGNELTLNFSTENTGLSELVITASANGKVAKSKFKVEVKIPTGIDPLFEDNAIQIYPNPTKGNVTIAFSQIPKSATRITVFSSNGKIIFQSPATKKEENINLNNQSPGLYFVKIDGESSRIYKLLLK